MTPELHHIKEVVYTDKKPKWESTGIDNDMLLSVSPWIFLDFDGCDFEALLFLQINQTELFCVCLQLSSWLCVPMVVAQLVMEEVTKANSSLWVFIDIKHEHLPKIKYGQINGEGFLLKAFFHSHVSSSVRYKRVCTWPWHLPEWRVWEYVADI